MLKRFDREARPLVLLMAASGFPIFIVVGLTEIYFMKWATDVLLVAPAAAGLILGMTRIWDGVNDPLIASLSDRSRSTRGRRRPLMRIGLVLLAIFAPLVWLPPESLSGPLLIVWLVVCLVIYETGLTMFEVSLPALGIQMITGQANRLYFNVLRVVPSLLAYVTAFAGLGWILTVDNPRSALLALMAIPAVLVLAMAAFVVPRLTEPSMTDEPRESGLLQMLRDVLRNRYHNSMLVIQAIQITAYGCIVITTPYIMDVVVGREDHLAPMLAAYYFIMTVACFGYMPVVRRLGLTSTWRLGLFLWAAAFCVLLTMPMVSLPARLPMAYALAALSGLAQASGVAVFPIIGDLADYDRSQSGRRREGLYVTLFRLVAKIAFALVAMMIGFGLEWGGYDPQLEVQPAGVTQSLMALGAAVPLSLTLIGIWMLGRWSFYRVQDQGVLQTG